MKNTISKTSFVLIFVLICSFNIFGQSKKIDNEKEKDIKKLINLTVGNDVGKRLIANIIESFKKTFPKVPNEYWEKLGNEINLDEFSEKLIPLYDKNFSLEDIVE